MKKNILFNYDDKNRCKFCKYYTNLKNNKEDAMFKCLECKKYFCFNCWTKNEKPYIELFQYVDNWINELPSNSSEQPKPTKKELFAVCSFKCSNL